MPHLTLEYTKNLQSKIDFKEIFSKIHGEIIKTGEFVLDDIKSRAICIEKYCHQLLKLFSEVAELAVLLSRF